MSATHPDRLDSADGASRVHVVIALEGDDVVLVRDCKAGRVRYQMPALPLRPVRHRGTLRRE